MLQLGGWKCSLEIGRLYLSYLFAGRYVEAHSDLGLLLDCLLLG